MAKVLYGDLKSGHLLNGLWKLMAAMTSFRAKLPLVRTFDVLRKRYLELHEARMKRLELYKEYRVTLDARNGVFEFQLDRMPEKVLEMFRAEERADDEQEAWDVPQSAPLEIGESEINSASLNADEILALEAFFRFDVRDDGEPEKLRARVSELERQIAQFKEKSGRLA